MFFKCMFHFIKTTCIWEGPYLMWYPIFPNFWPSVTSLSSLLTESTVEYCLIKRAILLHQFYLVYPLSVLVPLVCILYY
jgi:hypothetical protein